MRARVLVLALENYLSAARLPKALADAEFETAVICYPNALLALTRYAGRREFVHPSDDAHRIAQKMVDLIQEWGPKLVIPGDDRALRFMHHIVEVGGSGRLPGALFDLVRKSLPESSAFAYSADKRAASMFMVDLGYKVPDWRPITQLSEAVNFADQFGYPVVLKPGGGVAGAGVQICWTAAELQGATMHEGDWFVQRYILGVPAESSGVAWGGKLLGAILYERTLTDPREIGPTCLATIIDNETMITGLSSFAKATRHNGFLSIGWMLERETGQAYFLEVNARCVPIIGPSPKLGLNLCECLHAKLVGAPQPKPDPAAPRLIALYPQELHRDPQSPYRDHILDEPIDDPQVYRAMQRGIDLLAAGA